MAQWNKSTQSYRVQDTTNFEVVMLADQDGNPLNSYGSAANIPIAAGQLEGYSSIEKFGRNPSVATSIETIWDRGGIYEYLTSATAVYVYSANAADGLTGTGEDEDVGSEGHDNKYTSKFSVRKFKKTEDWTN